jgi:hypothetical protein
MLPLAAFDGAAWLTWPPPSSVWAVPNTAEANAITNIAAAIKILLVIMPLSSLLITCQDLSFWYV